MKKIGNNIKYFFLILFITGCQRNIIFHLYQTFTSEGWKKNTEIIFSPDTIKETSLCKVSIEFRNKINYPYKDLWLVISQNVENPNHLVSDTLHYSLTDSKGNYKGKGVGDLYELSFPYKTMLFKKGVKTTFKIKHIMKDNFIYGINDVGIRIEYDEKHLSSKK